MIVFGELDSSFSEKDAVKVSKDKWGQNLLGLVLEDVRIVLQSPKD
jgi:hypothetical protein